MRRLIAASHGTADSFGQEAVAALVEAVRAAVTGIDVVGTYVDVQTPALDDLDLDSEAVIVPLLLCAGFHTKVDISRAAERSGAAVAATLGPDPQIADLLVTRLLEAGARREDIVVLAVAGTRDHQGQQDAEAAAALLSEAWSGEVRVGALGGSGARLDDVIASVRGADRRVAVSNYLLAPGYFYGLLSTCAADVVAAPLLDDGPPDARLVRIVLERFFAAGGVRRSVDVAGLRGVS